jgi:TRAP-type C4-dicarboxylate transport system permease small subunit
MAASTFLALAYTFGEKGHIRITLFLEKAKERIRRFLELWCLFIASFFPVFYLIILLKC